MIINDSWRIGGLGAFFNSSASHPWSYESLSSRNVYGAFEPLLFNNCECPLGGLEGWELFSTHWLLILGRTKAFQVRMFTGLSNRCNLIIVSVPWEAWRVGSFFQLTGFALVVQKMLESVFSMNKCGYFYWAEYPPNPPFLPTTTITITIFIYYIIYCIKR